MGFIIVKMLFCGHSPLVVFGNKGHAVLPALVTRKHDSISTITPTPRTSLPSVSVRRHSLVNSVNVKVKFHRVQAPCTKCTRQGQMHWANLSSKYRGLVLSFLAKFTNVKTSYENRLESVIMFCLIEMISFTAEMISAVSTKTWMFVV